MPRNLSGLTIGTVAEQTGVSVAALRSWEQRHGFPVATRLPSGHRRYTQRDVDLIAQVSRDREVGLSLDAAIERTRHGLEPSARSLFSGLRSQWPDLTPHVLSKRVMLAISRAIEDEYCARAERPFLFGSFQRDEFYRASEARWRSLAETASVAVVMADFPSDRPTSSRPIEVGFDDDSPVRREWSIICDAPSSAACLVGWERPGHDGDGRRFEAIWTVEPAIVRDAARIGIDLVSRHVPALTSLADHLAPLGTAEPAVTLRHATALTNRVVAALDR